MKAHTSPWSQNGCTVVGHWSPSEKCEHCVSIWVTRLPPLYHHCASFDRPMASIERLLWRPVCLHSATMATPEPSWQWFCLHSAFFARPVVPLQQFWSFKEGTRVVPQQLHRNRTFWVPATTERPNHFYGRTKVARRSQPCVKGALIVVIARGGRFLFSWTLNRYLFVPGADYSYWKRMHCACSNSVLPVLMLQSSCQLSLGGNRLHHIMEASWFLDDDLPQTVVLHRSKPRISLQIPQETYISISYWSYNPRKSHVNNACSLPPPIKNSGEKCRTDVWLDITISLLWPIMRCT